MYIVYETDSGSDSVSSVHFCYMVSDMCSAVHTLQSVHCSTQKALYCYYNACGHRGALRVCCCCNYCCHAAAKHMSATNTVVTSVSVTAMTVTGLTVTNVTVTCQPYVSLTV